MSDIATSSHFAKAFEDASAVLNNFRQDQEQMARLQTATEMLIDCLQNGGKILTCGNGGSLCDAMHFSEELTGRYRKDRKPLAALSLTESAHISCVANDFGYDHIFSRQVEALGRPGDVLLAITTSGNSKNILKACQVARENKVKIIALTGKTGGAVKDYANVSIVVGSQQTDRIQEIHIKCIHTIIEGIERKLFPEHYPY